MMLVYSLQMTRCWQLGTPPYTASIWATTFIILISTSHPNPAEAFYSTFPLAADAFIENLTFSFIMADKDCLARLTLPPFPI